MHRTLATTPHAGPSPRLPNVNPPSEAHTAPKHHRSTLDTAYLCTTLHIPHFGTAGMRQKTPLLRPFLTTFQPLPHARRSYSASRPKPQDHPPRMRPEPIRAPLPLALQRRRQHARTSIHRRVLQAQDLRDKRVNIDVFKRLQHHPAPHVRPLRIKNSPHLRELPRVVAMRARARSRVELPRSRPMRANGYRYTAKRPSAILSCW